MSSSPQDGLPPARRYLAFSAVVIAVWSVVIDGTAIGVALPVLARDFGASAPQIIWVVAISQLVIVSTLLVFSSLGEIVGYRRIHQIGLVVFVAASLLCALAPNLPWLIAARGVQALGAACVMSLNFALVRHIFPAERLGWAVGLLATAVAVAACLGPGLAGAVLSVASWPWIFATIVPLALTSLLVGVFVLPQTPRSGGAFDGPGAGLSALTFGGLLLAVIGTGHGWPPPALAGLGGVSLAAGTALYHRLRHASAPLLPLDLLRVPLFSLSVTASICAFCAQMLAFVALPFLFIDGLGLTAFETGLAFSLWPLALAVTAPLAGRLADRLPPGPVGFAGLMVLVVALLLLANLPADAGVPDIGWRMALCGAGFGVFQSPNNRTMLGAAPRRRSGAASGMVATARLLGQALGTAIATFALAGDTATGPALALTVAAGFALLGGLISVSRRPAAR